MQFAHNPKLNQNIESSRRKTTTFDSLMPQKNWDVVRVMVLENRVDFRLVWRDIFYSAGFTMQFAQICNIFLSAVLAVDEDRNMQIAQCYLIPHSS